MCDTIATFYKGRISILDLLSDDLPFYEIHEFYRLVFLKMKAQEEEEERKAEEEWKKENEERAKKGLAPLPRPAGGFNNRNRSNKDNNTGPSSLQAEMLEDSLEEMFEGGV